MSIASIQNVTPIAYNQTSITEQIYIAFKDNSMHKELCSIIAGYKTPTNDIVTALFLKTLFIQKLSEQ